MGRPIARKMAEKLNISYYDRDLVDQAAEKLKLPVSVINQEEEKDAKILVNTVIKPTVVNCDSKQENTTKKKKRIGLFLKFAGRDDEKINSAMQLLSNHRGDFPLYFYYEDEKKYDLRNNAEFVSPDSNLVFALKKLLGDANVALIRQ